MEKDTRKAATVANHWHLRVARPVLEAHDVVVNIRAAITEHNLSGEFSQGEIDAMLAAESALVALAALPGITSAESRYAPTHKGNAITITGVND